MKQEEEKWLRQLKDEKYRETISVPYLVELFGIWSGNVAVDKIHGIGNDHTVSKAIREELRKELLNRLSVPVLP